MVWAKADYWAALMVYSWALDLVERMVYSKVGPKVAVRAAGSAVQTAGMKVARKVERKVDWLVGKRADYLVESMAA